MFDDRVLTSLLATLREVFPCAREGHPGSREAADHPWWPSYSLAGLGVPPEPRPRLSPSPRALQHLCQPSRRFWTFVCCFWGFFWSYCELSFPTRDRNQGLQQVLTGPNCSAAMEVLWTHTADGRVPSFLWDLLEDAPREEG